MYCDSNLDPRSNLLYSTFHISDLEQKYSKSLIEVRILRAKQIPLEILRQSKTAKNEEIIPFTFTYSPNNPNVFPIIKQSFDNFQYSKTMSHIFQRKKLVKSMSQAPNLGRLLCRSKFESQRKNHEVKNYGKNCVTYPYLLKASLYQYKRGKKTFLLKNSFNCESSNLSYLPRMQRRICRKSGLSSERVNKYLQAPYKTAAIATNGS